MQLRTSTPYTVGEFMSYIEQHSKGIVQGSVLEELPEFSEQGGAVPDPTHNSDVLDIPDTHANAQFGANQGS